MPVIVFAYFLVDDQYRAPGCQREYESRAAVNTVVLHPNQVMFHYFSVAIQLFLAYDYINDQNGIKKLHREVEREREREREIGTNNDKYFLNYHNTRAKLV